MDKLIYVSQPSRLGGKQQEAFRQHVIDKLTRRGMSVIHPFEAFPYERFEGNPGVGRELAMRFCCELISICEGGLALTGISRGTLIEVSYLLKHYPNRELLVFPEFDPLWNQKLSKYRKGQSFTPILEHISNLNVRSAKSTTS